MKNNREGTYGIVKGSCRRNTSPLRGETANGLTHPNSPVYGLTNEGSKDNRQRSLRMSSSRKSSLPKDRKCSQLESEKKYIGVRVKMPVRDMLTNLRLAKGLDPKDIQGHKGQTKGEKRRVVNTKVHRRNTQKKSHSKSLEELSIIVEVLEEDLKASTCYKQQSKPFSEAHGPELKGSPNSPELPLQSSLFKYSQVNEIPQTSNQCPLVKASFCPREDLSSPSSNDSPVSFFSGGYNSDESDEMTYSPCSYMAYSPGTNEYQVPSVLASPQPPVCASTQEMSDPQENFSPQWPDQLRPDWSSFSFFLAQLEKEEHLLRNVSDTEFLDWDENGMALLHRVVSKGKRALGYVIAKRMAVLNRLDVKDLEGKTALHLAAQKNQHLMVADLINLGANVNEKDGFGQTCLHLCAENGYIRVMEVLKNAMNQGVYVDLEALTNDGHGVLEYAAIALGDTLQELERSVCPSQVRLYTLRKEQLLETMECLIEMGCYLQNRGNYMSLKGYEDLHN